MYCLRYLAFVAALPLLADPPQPVAVNAVADVYRPFATDQEKLGGVIGARLRSNSEGYIEHLGARPVLAAAVPSGVLAGERGTLLDAAVYTFEYNRDPSINSVMVGLAKKLIAAQGPDGYLGARPTEQPWTEQDTWNESAYLVGLLHYYRLTGDAGALSAATKMGDLLLKERQRNAGQDAALFAGALEPIADLFRFTDQRKYLDFCNRVAEAWLHNKPAELPVTANNLAVLNGLVGLYRLNGDNSLLSAPLQAWTEMHASSFTLTGVPADDSARDSRALSACTTDAWLRLSLNLLRLTGQAVYGEQLERTVYNQLFAGQDAKTGNVLAPVAWAGKKNADNEGVCAAKEVRALSVVPYLIWGRYGNGLVMNLYTDGRLTVKMRRRGTIQLYAETNYPVSGNVLLHVEPDHPIHFPLRLRVPDWTSKFTADVDQDHFVGKPGDFLTINRAWKRGDTVKISIGMTARAIPGVKQFSADVAIARGPQVLALGAGLNPEIGDFSDVTIKGAFAPGLKLSPVDTNYAANWMGDQAYALEGLYRNQQKRLILVPFADATDYRVWLAQPKASVAAPSR